VVAGLLKGQMNNVGLKTVSPIKLGKCIFARVTGGEGELMHIIIEEALPDCLQIISRIAEWCDGKLPADRTRLVALLLDYFCRAEHVPPDIRVRLTLEQWEQVRANFAAGLVQALDIFTRDRDAMYLN
jgi:hypothetical protein